MPEKSMTKLNHKGEGDQLINQDGTLYANSGPGQQFNAKTITAHFGSLGPVDSCCKTAATRGWADPRDIKAGIESQNGPLVPDACKWILDHGNFKHWRDWTGCQVLWIHGEAGTGKTMLAVSIIKEMISWAKLQQDADEIGAVVAYVFCDQTMKWTDNPVAILRGLIYSLRSNEPSIDNLRDKCLDDLYANENQKDYALTISVLSNALLDALTILKKRVYFIVDGIDEIIGMGSHYLPGHLARIANSASNSRWLFFSKSLESVTNVCKLTSQGTDIELDKSNIVKPLEIYTIAKVSGLKLLDADPDLQRQVTDHILKTALNNGAFLWVRLICLWFELRCEELSNSPRLNHLWLMRSAPSGITHLAVETLLKSGQQEYRLYKRNNSREHMRLERAIAKYKDALLAADEWPVYKTGKVKAYISRAECHRELSTRNHVKFKMDQIADAERMLQKAQELVTDINDKSLLKRIEFEIAVTSARRLMLEMRLSNFADRVVRNEVTGRKDATMKALESLKLEFLRGEGKESATGERITKDWMQALEKDYQKWAGRLRHPV